jgi:hypothetical protein
MDIYSCSAIVDFKSKVVRSIQAAVTVYHECPATKAEDLHGGHRDTRAVDSYPRVDRRPGPNSRCKIMPRILEGKVVRRTASRAAD